MSTRATPEQLKNLMALHSCKLTKNNNGWYLCETPKDTWGGISQHHDLEWWLDRMQPGRWLP